MSNNPIVRSALPTPAQDRRSFRVYKELIEHKDPALNYYEHHIIEVLVNVVTGEIVMASLIDGLFGQDMEALKDEIALINKAMTLPVLTEEDVPEDAWLFEEDDEQ